ncbi:dehalogenase [Dehalogenimonas etheniformans]|uniref:Dehalogenase n=1 Tax=Dehalogenimonas etheniformans TaxID=1536648 RepID=A0A2P5P7Y5_9CHLR|nr:dehalogenase [Dehalogenimonas etheniformans]PPD58412.1 dehalogenase [Dehalogenimonas etheniformans]QNT76985.1 dehalogenase [Dehalogenimonas etheniformans]
MGGVLYYLLVGAVLGGAAVWFVTYTHFKNRNFKWWEWVLMALSLLLVLSVFQHMYASMRVEMEFQSAFMYLAIFGGIALILDLIVLRTYNRRKE